MTERAGASSLSTPLSVVLNKANTRLYYAHFMGLKTVSVGGGDKANYKLGGECNPTGIHSVATRDDVIWCTS